MTANVYSIQNLKRMLIQNTEYVFVRAMGKPNRNTTAQRRLLKIF